MNKKTKPKILLIGTPWVITKSSLDYLTAPVLNGLGYIAAVLEKNNYDVKILDALAEGFGFRKKIKNGQLIKVGLPNEKIVKKIKEYKPEIIGISNLFSSQSYTMFELTRLVKKTNPEITVVVGGVHPSADPNQCIKDKNIDFVIVGEGEYTLLKLIQNLNNPDKLSNIKGLFYKKGSKVHPSGMPRFVENLNDIPFPAYHLLPMKKYLEISKSDLSTRNIDRKGYLPIISSRGCPFSCFFCGAHLLVGKMWRFRSPKNFVDEIEFLQKKYGADNFTFEDSNFTFNQSRTEEICDEIINRNLNIKWSLPNGIRADKITNNLIAKMKKSGCRDIAIGIEHGNQEYLNKFIKKSLKLADVKKAVEIITKNKITISGFFIMGFPNETKALIKDTISFALKLARKGMMPLFSILIPLPGTELKKYAEEHNLLAKKNLSSVDYLLSSHSKPTVFTKNLSAQKIVNLRRKARILSAINMMLFSPTEFFRHPFVKQFLKSFISPKLFIKEIKLILTKLNIGT